MTFERNQAALNVQMKRLFPNNFKSPFNSIIIFSLVEYGSMHGLISSHNSLNIEKLGKRVFLTSAKIGDGIDFLFNSLLRK